MDRIGDEVLKEIVTSTKEWEAKDLRERNARNDELLSLLDLDLKDLTPRADELLARMAEYQKVTHLKILNPMSVYCWCTDLELEKMEYRSYILELEQNIAKIQRRQSKEKSDLELFKRDLKLAKEKVAKEAESENFAEIKQSDQIKIEKYEKQLAECMARLSKCNIPVEILPENIKWIESELAKAKTEKDSLKIKADYTIMAKSAKKDLISLRNKCIQTPSK